MSGSLFQCVQAFSCLSIAGVAIAGQPALQFTNQTELAGLTSTNEFSDQYPHPLMVAAGLAGDFNNDGFDDILQLGSSLPNNLFINNKDGTFTNRADEWGIAGPFHSNAPSAADFNNDGYLDLFITAYGSADSDPQPNKHMLLMNNGPDENGQWSFTDVAQSAGVSSVRPGSGYIGGSGSGWGDFDLDGDLDLFVCAYSSSYPANRLYRNDGPDKSGVWRFTDVTQQAGLEYNDTPGFIPSFVDMNGDRYPELILVADTGTSKFFVNNRDGTFTNATNTAHGLSNANAMGIDVADINNDQRLDFFISNIRFVNPPTGGNVLLIQSPDGSFENMAPQSNCRDGYWGWGSLINDFDHDGDKDILETNGYFFGFGGNPATLYLNNGDATNFTESALDCGIAHISQGRGLIRIDADNDGDLDVVIFSWLQPTAFFRNELIMDKTPSNAHWARIKLNTNARDTIAPQGIGAMVTVTTPDNSYILPIHNNTSYCGASPVDAHIGLAEESSIESIRVAWPDGSFNTWVDMPIDTIHNLSAPVHPADFDFSETVDFNDVLAFINAIAKRSLTADHNGDTQIDFFDIAAFLDDYHQATSP